MPDTMRLNPGVTLLRHRTTGLVMRFARAVLVGKRYYWIGKVVSDEGGAMEPGDTFGARKERWEEAEDERQVPPLRRRDDGRHTTGQRLVCGTPLHSLPLLGDGDRAA